MNKVVEVLRRERAELRNVAEDDAGAIRADAFADRRRRIGEIEALLREFEEV